MRSTVLIDDELAAKAKELTGISKTSPMINEVLQDYVRRQSAKRLSALKGTMPDIAAPPRQRF